MSAAPSSPQPLPTAADLARALGVHVATVYRACNSGEIAAVRIRGTVRIPWREYRRLTGDTDTASATA